MATAPSSSRDDSIDQSSKEEEVEEASKATEKQKEHAFQITLQGDEETEKFLRRLDELQTPSMVKTNGKELEGISKDTKIPKEHGAQKMQEGLGENTEDFAELAETIRKSPIMKLFENEDESEFDLRTALQRDPTATSGEIIKRNMFKVFEKFEEIKELQGISRLGRIFFEQYDKILTAFMQQVDDPSLAVEPIDSASIKSIEDASEETEKLEEDAALKPVVAGYSNTPENQEESDEVDRRILVGMLEDCDKNIRMLQNVRRGIHRDLQNERKTLGIPSPLPGSSRQVPSNHKSVEAIKEKQLEIDSGRASSIRSSEERSVISENWQQYKDKMMYVKEWIEHQVPKATELKDEGIQTDITEVQTNDKSQQTDDFPSQKPKELPHTIGCSATTTKVIGPKGGTIALHGYKVLYPPNSLKEKKEIELSIDANPSNFPEEGLPVTSILNIKPSMKLEIPAIVSMPTSCRAASGKVKVQIWSKEFDEEWKKTQKVSLATINRITFRTFHFSGQVATSVPGNEDNIEHIIKNRLFIQKDTATFSSVFWQDDELMQETKKRYKEMKYAGARPTDITLEGKLNTEFKLKLESTSPDLQYTSNGQNPVIFKLKSKFLKARCPISIEFHITEDIPERTRNMKMTYSVIVNGVLDEECPLSVPWPIEINQEGPSSASPDVQVNIKKEITGYKAESGGTIQASNGKIDTQISG